MNSGTNLEEYIMTTQEIATRHLKKIGCKIFQVIDAQDAKVLFDHYRGLGAQLDELLMPAVRGKAQEFVRLLLANGVKPTQEIMKEWATYGRSGILNLLLDAGGVPTFEVILDVIRLPYCDASDRVILLGLILTKAKPNLSQEERDQLLIEAVHRGYGSGTQQLLINGFGANVDVECRGGTPLIYACKTQDDKHALYLIENGADIDYRRPGRWSARTFAKRHREVMPLTHARISRHELTKLANNKRKMADMSEAQVRRAM